MLLLRAFFYVFMGKKNIFDFFWLKTGCRNIINTRDTSAQLLYNDFAHDRQVVKKGTKNISIFITYVSIYLPSYECFKRMKVSWSGMKVAKYIVDYLTSIFSFIETCTKFHEILFYNLLHTFSYPNS